MSGYAVSARIIRANPRTMEHRRIDPSLEWRPSDAGAVVVDEGWVIRPGASISVIERWERFRDRLGQLTFFLTDPNSWR